MDQKSAGEAYAEPAEGLVEMLAEELEEKPAGGADKKPGKLEKPSLWAQEDLIVKRQNKNSLNVS